MQHRRFFAASSFWNQRIEPDPEIDPESGDLLNFMASLDNRGFWVNLDKWAVPIYSVDRSTPRRKVFQRFRPGEGLLMKQSANYLRRGHPMGHGKEFAYDAGQGNVPVPDNANADPKSDSHIALVDWNEGWIWEMWKARRLSDGNWQCNSGMKYRLDGSGVFDRGHFDVHDGESIHPYGPCRAAGVPLVAGAIMRHEIMDGRIEHKLGFATQAAGLQRFVYPPACWSDGGWRQGVPEGAVLQLDPGLDLEQFQLSRHALVVARALQEYGAVCVDVAVGHPLYAEGLYNESGWNGILRHQDLLQIRMCHYRVLKMKNVIRQGMTGRPPDGIFSADEKGLNSGVESLSCRP